MLKFPLLPNISFPKKISLVKIYHPYWEKAEQKRPKQDNLCKKNFEIWTDNLIDDDNQSAIDEAQRKYLMPNSPVSENCPPLGPPKLKPLMQKLWLI